MQIAYQTMNTADIEEDQQIRKPKNPKDGWLELQMGGCRDGQSMIEVREQER